MKKRVFTGIKFERVVEQQNYATTHFDNFHQCLDTIEQYLEKHDGVSPELVQEFLVLVMSSLSGFSIPMGTVRDVSRDFEDVVAELYRLKQQGQGVPIDGMNTLRATALLFKSRVREHLDLVRENHPEMTRTLTEEEN